MRDIIEITEALAALKPGSRIRVTGYVPSKKSPRDYDLELLPADGYRRIQRESLEMLRDFLQRPEEQPAAVEIVQGVETLVASLEKSLDAASTPPTRSGPAYERIKDGSLYTLPSAPGAVYLQRLLRLSDPPEDEKLESVTAAVTRLLNLPVGRYIHVIQLAEGKFDSVEVL